MGYYCNYNGTLKLKENVDIELVKNELQETFENAEIVDEQKIFVYGYGKYYEEDFKETFKKVSSYLEQGEIEFEGEDYEKWRYIVCKNGKCQEQNGYVAYTHEWFF